MLIETNGQGVRVFSAEPALADVQKVRSRDGDRWQRVDDWEGEGERWIPILADGPHPESGGLTWPTLLAGYGPLTDISGDA